MLWVAGLLLVLLPVAVLAGRRLASSPPRHLGAADGRLAPCPRTPNCVCSQAPDAAHRVDPLPLHGAAADATARLARVIERLDGRVVRADERYLRAEFTSRLFRFVDDLELLLDAPGGRIEVRSASRVGYGDLGVNRRRVEALRDAWLAEAGRGGGGDGAKRAPGDSQ